MTLIPSRGIVFDQEGGWTRVRHHLILGCRISALADDEVVAQISFCQPGISMDPVWCRLSRLPEQLAKAAGRALLPATASTGGFFTFMV